MMINKLKLIYSIIMLIPISSIGQVKIELISSQMNLAKNNIFELKYDSDVINTPQAIVKYDVFKEELNLYIFNYGKNLIEIQNPFAVNLNDKNDFSELIYQYNDSTYLVDFNRELLSNPFPNLRDYNFFTNEQFLLYSNNYIQLKISNFKIHPLKELVKCKEIVIYLKIYYRVASLVDDKIMFSWPIKEDLINSSFIISCQSTK